MSEQVDVLIVGGGLVGCSLAIALQSSGLRIGLIESQAGQQAVPPSFDERNLALARASLNALQSLAVLPLLERAPAPITQIHVSRQGDFGAVRLRASDYGQDALGGVVMARDLGSALQQRVAQLSALQHWAPATLMDLQPDEHGWRAEIEQAGERRMIQAALLVGADGTSSLVRQRVGIGSQPHDYGQTLFVCSVRSSRPVDGSAWERFTDHGPVALLPRNDGRYGAVCAVPTAQVADIRALDSFAYRDYLQSRFGYRAGRFLDVGARSLYPLRQISADELIAARAVLIGNAAQTLHPIGAQGFNLGLRDALTLAELIAEGGDPGTTERLALYAARRNEDRQQTIGFSDGLARMTAAPGFTAHVIRSLGLLLLERSVSMRAPLVSGAMGFRGHVPQLARAQR